MDVPSRVIIVGAGLAGTTTATELRHRGYAGQIVLIGNEMHRPYDRPPLSKAVLLAPDDPPDPVLPFDPGALDVDLRLGVTATGWRPGRLHTDAGDLDCPALVIATGAVPIRLPGEGARYLRTRDDAFALREALREGSRVVIVGAGWIGAEVATAARKRGCAVTVVERASAPVAHALPGWIGSRLARWYAETGVDLRCDTTVTAVRPDGVELAGGDRLPADVVLVAVGVRPALDWLADSPLPLDRGLLVTPDLAAETTTPAGVWAVGDAVARWSPRYGRRIRGEHWDDALRAPAVVAANVLGGSQTYDPVPYVWSEQFGRMVQYAGRLDAADRAIMRGDPDRDPTWATIWLDERGVITGILAVDRPRDFVPARRLADAGTPVDPARLTDPNTPVKNARLT